MDSALKLSALGAASLLFVSPFKEFEEVRRSKQVGERSVLPYVCMWGSSSLWVIYGLFIGDIVPTVVTNLVGLAFSLYYCAVFAWAVEPASRKSSTYNLYAASFLLVCLVVTFCMGNISLRPEKLSYLDDANSRDVDVNERSRHFLGVAASSATAIQFAAPLAELVKVMRRRSTEGMSLTLAVVSFLCSSLWLSYGVVVWDPFIYVPNVLGLCFSTTQLVLFWWFPRKKGNTSLTLKARLEDPYKGVV